MIKFLLSNRFGFLFAGLLLGGFGTWMLVEPGLFAEGWTGRLSLNRKVLAAIWGNIAGVVLVILGLANFAAAIFRGGSLDADPEGA